MFGRDPLETEKGVSVSGFAEAVCVLENRSGAGSAARSCTLCNTPVVSFLPHTGQIPFNLTASSGERHTPHFLWPSIKYFPS